MRVRVCVFLLAAMLAAAPAFAATVTGVVTDATGARVAGATVVLRDVATGREVTVQTGQDGRYTFDAPTAGRYLLRVSRTGFAPTARTVVVEDAAQRIELSLTLGLASVREEVTVTAARAEREVRQIPLHVETISGEAVAQSNATSTGDALAMAANVTQVGNGPFGVRPRLRGLDSTRLLVLVDGERLNTARQATDRTGAEVGLIAPDVISRLEIVNGAGTLLYGSDALAGTINIVTNEPGFTPARRFMYGFDGFYSTNENGRRGTVTVGATGPRYAVRFQGGLDQFDNYRAGDFDTEDTAPLFASGTLTNADTIDDAFGFSFGAFPDPFNRPFVRTDAEIPNSQAEGRFFNLSALLGIGERRTLRVRAQSRRVENIGFPDFAQPFFFNATSLPFSNLDRVSARYEAQAVTPWLANLSLSAYYQKTNRLLRNLLPVQFPAPTPMAFFPIAVMRLDILSDTQQTVTTPGMDLQAVLVPARDHLTTVGLTFFRDGSEDTRTTTTATSMIGQVALGQFGPAATVFPSPIALGPPSVAHPVRVPDASLRDVAVFVQDEWRIRPDLALTAGLRADFYRVTTRETPGYDVASIVAGADPAIDPATLPDPAGTTISRRALTGDVGLLINPGGTVSPFVRVGRSYRHPNLEELLFAGPATIGSLAPNILVKPEVGTNLDAGTTFRIGRVSAGAFAFVNHYRDFIAQDTVSATTPQGSLSQAQNFGNVRIAGVELSAEAPIVFGPGAVTLSGAAAFTRGTIVEGQGPLGSLDDTPLDNITPVKAIISARFTERSARWWVEYGARVQTKVDRVAATLLESPFLIAQDLLALDGFVIQRIGWGVQVPRTRESLAVTFAIENLTDRFYREQFQFAPARGRTFTIGLRVGAR